MTKYDDIHKSFKELLSKNLNGDNTETITQLATKLDELKQEHEKTVQENTKLKDQIVDYVKNTSFKEEPNEDLNAEEVDLDELIASEVNNVIKERK